MNKKELDAHLKERGYISWKDLLDVDVDSLLIFLSWMVLVVAVIMLLNLLLMRWLG